MPKKKQFLQQAAGSKQKANPAGKKKQPPEPETEDEFLDAADEHEKAAGKWRRGDAAKSMRFFQRAIDAYAAGLAKFPKSFDLAYNKALLEYEITQDPRIAREFKHPRIGMLKQALASHQYALKLNPTNLDVRFNTAQVMSSLAESLEDANEGEGVDLYCEAVVLMTKVYADQETEYNALQEAFEAANRPQEESAAVTTSTPRDSDSPSSNEYATVEEAVTERAILDTFFSCSRMMAELMLILPVDRYDQVLADIANCFFRTFRNDSLRRYFDKLSRTRPEAAPPSLSLTIGAAPPKPAAVPLSPWEEATREYYLEQAVFMSAQNDLHFRLGDDPSLTPNTWYMSILVHFGFIYRFPYTDAVQPTIPPTADGVCAYAEALLDLVDAIAPSAASRRENEEHYIFQCSNGAFKDVSETEITLRSDPELPLDPIAACNVDSVLVLSPHQLYMDALNRASFLLTFVAPTLAEPEKIPSLHVLAGDVQWRLRNAYLAFLGQLGSSSSPQSDLVRAWCHEKRAEEHWLTGVLEHTQSPDTKDVDESDEFYGAYDKVAIGRFARGDHTGVMRNDEELEETKARLRKALVGMVRDGWIAEKVLDMANGVGWF
ncbi:uncharacterized protein BKA78DRAFT_315413 [Phyllosticta capitalensis]|uniref:uncharacterized protein n=1 Tax=Phyllosticta capitalensis TaxID=121624 RepID=UPI00312F4A85